MKEPKKYPCEDAFLKNPVVSANDATGYAVVIPQNDSEACALSNLLGGVPLQSHKDCNTESELTGKPSPKKSKNRSKK